MPIFADVNIKKQLDHFLAELLLGVEKLQVLKIYQKAFQSSINQLQIINNLYKYLHESVILEYQIEDIQYIAESLIFCLAQQSLSQFARSIIENLKKLTDNQKLKQLFELSLLHD